MLLTPHLQESEGLFLTGKISKELIDAFTRQIKAIETWVMKQLPTRQTLLESLDDSRGGRDLAMTILWKQVVSLAFPKWVTTCLTVVGRQPTDQ